MHCTPEETRTVLLWGFALASGFFILITLVAAYMLAEWRAYRDRE